ncbi:MAG: 50S ribosomal protein L10 [Simkania sp.]|nr:50S ribosomal protein L10 [Simkania sp.]
MRAEKQLLLDEIQEKLEHSKALVLTSYQKLEPNTAANLRDALRKQGGGLEVVRKRILAKAAAASGFALDLDILQGHIAVFFIDEDPVTVTKTIFDFSKEHVDTLTVLGGRFEGRFCSATDVEQISKLPTKDEMRAQFLGLLEAPMSQTLATFEALLSSVMHCLENKSQESAST